MPTRPGESTDNPAQDAEPHDAHSQHVLPIRVYFLVWAALMLLLALTLGVGHLDLDAALHVRALNLNMIAALLIAGTKAALVLLFFMHVKYSSKLTWVFAAAGLLWLAVLIGLTMSDYLTRGWRY